MDKKLMLIINPAAGRGGYKLNLPDALHLLDRGGFRTTLFFTAGRGDRVVLRQGQRGRHIVRRTHGEVAHGGRIVELHQSRQHLAERAVTADACHGIKTGRMRGSKFCGVASL